MNSEQAWDAILRQNKKNNAIVIKIIIALLFILAGVITLAFFTYAGIGMMLFGMFFMTFSIKRAGRKMVDTDSIYVKNILTPWLLELFDTVEFDCDDDFDDEELEEADYWQDSWEQSQCARAFHGTYKGISFRAAEVFTYSMPLVDGRKRHKYDLDEPEYVFQGRIWEIAAMDCGKELLASDMADELGDMRILYRKGKLVLLHNLFTAEGTYPWWMQGPDGENPDKADMKNEVMESMHLYVKIMDFIAERGKYYEEC